MLFEKLLTPEEHLLVEQLSCVAQQLKIEAYLVGGFVRDKIINRTSKDIDIVCIERVEEFAETFQIKYYPSCKLLLFKNFGTAHLESATFNIEFVGARKESYHAASRNPIVSLGSFFDDQLRRDFTINTLAVNVENPSVVIDNFNGINDLKYGIIKTPTDPNITFFDDPLRILRGIRFACQLRFEINEQTAVSMQANSERLKIVAKERIAEELNKIMLVPKPSEGLLLLWKMNILHSLMPELLALSGVATVDGIQHKDNFFHSLKVLDNLAEVTENVWLRWAGLLHDIGKSVSKKFEKNVGWTFHGHEIVSAKMVKKIFERLGLPLNEKMNYVKKIISLHHRPISLTKEAITDSAIRRLLFDAGNELEDLMLLCEADITSKNEKKVAQYLENFKRVRERLIAVEEKDKIRNWQPPITGDMIMQQFNLKPSKEIGVIKTAIREAILDGKIENNVENATFFMMELLKNWNPTMPLIEHLKSAGKEIRTPTPCSATTSK